MKRREVICILLAPILLHERASAQRRTRAKVGVIYPGPAAAAQPRLDAFFEGLSAAGYKAAGIDLIVRIADGKGERLSSFATELAIQEVDVLVAISTPAAQAAKQASAAIPVVAHDLETDPVRSGLVASLSRPGGNVTGFFFDFPDFRTKLLELVREVIPGASRAMVLSDPAAGSAQLEGLTDAARLLRLQLQLRSVATVTEIEQTIATAKAENADALVVLSSPMIGANARRLGELTLARRLPAIALFPDFARGGGLLAYGPNILETYRGLGAMAGKVLDGASPAELPVQLPSRFELVVNLQTARLLGLNIPPAVLLRADEVIE
jgi:putative ABC transport system substrate-binding protein